MGNQAQYKKQLEANNSNKQNQEVSSKQYSSNNIVNIISNDMKQLNLYSKIIKHSELTFAFKRFAIDGLYLNYEKFNDCIGFLLKFDIPLLCYTYLSERLFKLMDKVY